MKMMLNDYQSSIQKGSMTGFKFVKKHDVEYDTIYYIQCMVLYYVPLTVFNPKQYTFSLRP